MSQRTQELVDQRVDPVWNLSGRKVSRARKLHVARAGHRVVDLLLVFRRMGGIVHAAKDEEPGLQRWEPSADVERIDRFQVVVLREWPDLTVPLQEPLP